MRPSSSTSLLQATFLTSLQKPSSTLGHPPEVMLELTQISMCTCNSYFLYLTSSEGRVCLSLLGTWHSHNDTESWTNKSTLLQLFLSIQSLVLTARPYYNEAGFQTHVGLDEALVNERLYSERAYFLSRGFVKWVLENAMEGLEEEVKYLYLSPDGPQLGKAVIEDGKRVIATSEVPGEDDGEWERGRVTRVSRGGLEVLKRTISALERIVERNNTATTNSDAMN